MIHYLYGVNYAASVHSHTVTHRNRSFLSFSGQFNTARIYSSLIPRINDDGDDDDFQGLQHSRGQLQSCTGSGFLAGPLSRAGC